MNVELDIEKLIEKNFLESSYVEKSKYLEKEFLGYYDYLEIKESYFKKCDFFKGVFQGVDIERLFLNLVIYLIVN